MSDQKSDQGSNPQSNQESCFSPNLTARQVHSRLTNALAELQRAEQNAVLWFAEIMCRDLYRQLGYSSIQQYATEALGFSQSKTYQFIRLASALQKLPQLHQSVAEGEIGWTKAREVARVATPGTQERWIREAKNSSNRQLEQKVVSAIQLARNARRSDPNQQELAVHATSVTCKGHNRGGAPADPSAEVTTMAIPPAETMVEVPVTVTLRFTPEQLARYEALLEQIGKSNQRYAGHGEPGGESRRPLGREDLHLAALEDHLATLNGINNCHQKSMRHGARMVEGLQDCTRVQSASHYQIVIYRCEECGRGKIQTRHGARELSPAALQAAACDSRILPMAESEASATSQQNRASIPPGIRRQVLARDHHRCRMKGCGQTRFLEIHHLVPRAAGGKNDQGNLVTLCASCHRLLHELFLKGKLSQEGLFKISKASA